MSLCQYCNNEQVKGLVIVKEFYCGYECYNNEYNIEMATELER